MGKTALTYQGWPGTTGATVQPLVDELAAALRDVAMCHGIRDVVGHFWQDIAAALARYDAERATKQDRGKCGPLPQR